jgi:hypothetical protein
VRRKFSFLVEVAVATSSESGCDRWSVLNSAQWNSERAENNWERQGPEAELDFQGGSASTTGDESDDAGEGNACSVRDSLGSYGDPSGDHRDARDQDDKRSDCLHVRDEEEDRQERD